MNDVLPPCLAEPRLVVALPARADEPQLKARLGAVLEVLAQKGFRTVSLHQSNSGWLTEVRTVFGARLEFGVHGPTTVDEAERLRDLRPAFILANTATSGLVEWGREYEVCVLPAALTPNEILAATALGTAAVQVLPADVMGGAYGDALKLVLPPGLAFVPRGGLGAWAVGRWFEAGARCCVIDDALLGDALNLDGNLAHLRERCQSFLDQVPAAGSDIA